MILNPKFKFPELDKIKISRVVVLSGFLTFLYIVEFGLGVRTVYHAFHLWNTPYYSPKVSWTICVESLLICVVVTFLVNIVSAMWEQRELKDEGKLKTAIRFTSHILVGGVLWRYMSLWFRDKKDLQKRESLLLAMNKFLFTQFFTIPLTIIHLSLMESFDEAIYDLCSVMCVAFNMILMFSVFDWCRCETNEVKAWGYESINLVPLMFSQNPVTSEEQANTDINSVSKAVENEQNPTSEAEKPKEDHVETLLLKLVTLFQTFSFTFGRLLSLGILLKLAGFYAASIMLFKLLLSVVYLKFQTPFLVSDSLAKWRQLLRLSFLSYILIFEWFLNRDPKTGYDFTANVKNSVIFYTIAIVESIFYFTCWAITEAFYSDIFYEEAYLHRNTFVRNVIIIGTLSLVLSFMFHVLLIFWQSRKLTRLIYTVRRQYLSTKLKMSQNNNGSCFSLRKAATSANHRPPLEISSPIPVNTIDGMGSFHIEEGNGSNLENHNSYKDLREPVDNEIEVFSRKNGTATNTVENKSITKVKSDSAKKNTENDSGEVDKNSKARFSERFRFHKISKNTTCESVQRSSYEDATAANRKVIQTEDPSDGPSKSDPDTKINIDTEKCSKHDQAAVASNQRSKVSVVLENTAGQWNKFSNFFQKTSENAFAHLETRKEQLKNFRKPSGPVDSKEKSSNRPEKTVHFREPCSTPFSTGQPQNTDVAIPEDTKSTSQKLEPEDDVEDINLDDQKLNSLEDDTDSNDNDCDLNDVDFNDNDYDEDIIETGNHELNYPTIEYGDDDHALKYPPIEDGDDVSHQDGDQPCPCYLCKTVDSSRLFNRRRSSSLPPTRRKSYYDDGCGPRGSPLFGESAAGTDEFPEADFSSYKIHPREYMYSLSLLPTEDRLEHFV